MADDVDGAEGLDLTPRRVDPAPRRRWGAVVATAVVLLAFAFVLLQVLRDATLFFYNADEAVELRDDLGADRFRLQGTVVPCSLTDLAAGVGFTVTYAGVDVAVEHTGTPPELFAEGMPVVLEGRWAGGVYVSDEILVKHDEVYVEENSSRLADAEPAAAEGCP